MREDKTKQAERALNDFLCFAVYATSHEFNHLYRGLLADFGLTYPQYLVMTLLWRGDDRTVSTIGQELGLESNTLTPLLKRLETLGLVERRRDTKDERVVRIVLTSDGKALKARAKEIPACVADAVGLNAKEMKDLIRSLEKVQRKLADHRDGS